MLFSRSLLSFLVKCTWSVDLKMFNFSNCLKPSEVTLESIFGDSQGRMAHLAGCWDLFFITDLLHVAQLLLHEVPQLKSDQSQGQASDDTCGSISVVARNWSTHTGDSPAKGTLYCRRSWDPLQIYASVILTKSCLHLKSVILSKVAQDIPGHLKQKCFGGEISSHSKTSLWLWVASQALWKSKAGKSYFLPKSQKSHQSHQNMSGQLNTEENFAKPQVKVRIFWHF